MRIYRQGNEPLDFVQIYGERNSGTTYLCKLLQDNMNTPGHLLGTLQNDATPLGHKMFGYKHWFINRRKFDDDNLNKTLFVVVYRNPYTWIRAMMERPYALERSIGGKPVKELPDTKLYGHINGRDTTNEFDPDTRQPLTIFELRRKKIESFEGLRKIAGNVVYLNLEDFIADPEATLTRIAKAFPSAFTKTRALDRKPYRQLVTELTEPVKFDEKETRVLNKAIDWTTETAIGYQKDNYTAPDDRTAFVILHGGSSVGKTYLMKQAADRLEAVDGLEMDAAQYWKSDVPRLNLDSLRTLLPDARETDVKKLRAALNTKSAKTNKCVNFLLNTLGEDRAEGLAPVIVATCGALPDPVSTGEPSIYSWLALRLPITFHHVLIDVDPETHKERMAKRGRDHLETDIIRLHAKKVANRDNFDAVVSDFDELRDFLSIQFGTGEATEPQIQPAPSDAPLPCSTRDLPEVRIHRNGPKYIQIFGERSSGTKYLTQLISEKMRAPDRVLGSYATKSDPVNKAKMIGYKHYYPRPEKVAANEHQTLFLVVYKNPYTWIRSMLGKPYHFAKCLEGKSIVDLPNLPLAGFDIHGKEIPDVHPVTGERITMFELRKHKILEWEALAEQVSNVAYFNYESLLLSPTPAIQRITDAFPGLFTSATAPDHVPDQKYVRKYVTPKPFSDAEMKVMDAHIDWDSEALIGYEKGNLFI